MSVPDHSPPAVDPELAPVLAGFHAIMAGASTSISDDNLSAVRAGFSRSPAAPDAHFARDGRFTVQVLAAERAGDEPAVPLLVCHPSHRRAAGCIVFLHGGGMVLGGMTDGVDAMLDHAEALDLAVVSVDYRLAPETRHPGPVEDCWWALRWVFDHADELDVPADRIVIAGESAGGGLAASCVLLARERGGPHVLGQLLMAPMLDDRNDSPSMRALGSTGMWDRSSNAFGWRALLGDLHGAADVPGTASPARATDLAGLPPTCIDVGGADAFRDECVEFATRAGLAGVLVDLHVWAGAFHGFDGMAPTAAVSRSARETRRKWLARVLGSGPNDR